MNLLSTVCQGQGWHVSEVAGYAGHQSGGVVSVSMARRELRLLVMEMKFQCKYGFAVDFLNLFFFCRESDDKSGPRCCLFPPDWTDGTLSPVTGE